MVTATAAVSLDPLPPPPTVQRAMRTAPDEDLSPLARMVRSEAFPGVLLVGCAVVAIALANSPWAEAWGHFWHTDLALTVGERTIAKTASHWINDGLMVLFFSRSNTRYSTASCSRSGRRYCRSRRRSAACSCPRGSTP